MKPKVCPYCCVANLVPTCVEEETNSGWHCPKCGVDMVMYVINSPTTKPTTTPAEQEPIEKEAE